MAGLREALAEAGHPEARTLGQSGNVVLASSEAPDAVARRIEELVEAAFGVSSGVLTRSREELEAVVAADPLAGVATDPRRHQVLFLATAPDPAVADAIAALDVAPEQVVLDGRELHCWHPDGIRDSRLSRRLDALDLGPAATARNWNTIVKLVALAGAVAGED